MKTNMALGPRGELLIKGFEKLALIAYRRFPGEPWTAGWGHTGPDVTEGTTCTPEQAQAWFKQDTRAAVDATNRDVTFPALTQCQFDALVCFAYNVGIGAEAHSTLLALVNEGKWIAAGDEFLKWDHVNGKEVDGLKRRREAERQLFCLGVVTP